MQRNDDVLQPPFRPVWERASGYHCRDIGGDGSGFFHCAGNDAFKTAVSADHRLEQNLQPCLCQDIIRHFDGRDPAEGIVAGRGRTFA